MRNSSAPWRDAPSSLSVNETVTIGSDATERDMGERVLTSDSGLLSLFPLECAETSQSLQAAAEARQWKRFLNCLADADPALRDAVRAAQSFWNATRTHYPRVRLPVTSRGETGLELVWRTRDGKYIDLEISRDGRFEWLYRDSRNDITRTGGPTVNVAPEFTHHLTKHFLVE